MTEYLNELLKRVKKPISVQNPSGENARYDEKFEKIKTEVMKLTAGTAEIDWEEVLRNSDSLLSGKTKDLTIVAYLSLVLVKKYEYPGLVTGLKILHHFIDEHWWDIIFPPVKREKARVQIFEWINERLSVMVGATEPKKEDADALRECKALADGLPDKVMKVVRVQVTGFGSLRKELDSWVAKLPAKKAESESESEKKNEEDKQREPQGQAGVAPKIAQEAKMALPMLPKEIESIDDGLKAISEIIQMIRKAQPTNAIAYRLARVTKWDNMENAPWAAPDGKTRIPAPPQERFTILETQENAKNWPVLTQTAEHMFISEAGCTFNINLQRYVALGLENQGAEDASKTVFVDTGRILLRLPELIDLTYDTGLPFADNEARKWAEEAMEEARGPGHEDGDDDDEWLKEATKIAHEKNITKALPIFQNAISNARDTKNVMKRQLDVARFLLSNRESHWAVPILGSLCDRIEEVRLAEWDPYFCSDVWEMLLKGYERLPKKGKVSEKELLYRDTIKQKLFSVNIVKAAALTPKK